MGNANVEKLVVWCIFAKDNYWNLRKIVVNFREVSLDGEHNKYSGTFRQTLLKVAMKKLKSPLLHIGLQ